MLRSKFKLVVIAAIFSAASFAGRVSFAAEPAIATTQLGLALPLVGDLKDIADPGFALGAQLMHKADAFSSYGIQVGYITFGSDSEDDVETEVSIISTLAMTQRNLAGRGQNAPFFEGGFGFARTQVNIEQMGTGGAAVARGRNEEDISPTILLGLGFDAPVMNGAIFGMSVDYQHFFFKVGDVSGGGSLNINAHLRI